MKQILACLLFILTLAIAPVKADATSLPKDAVFLLNNGKVAIYMYPPDKHLINYGWYFTIEQIIVPIGKEEIKFFRDEAQGEEPGYCIMTYAFKVAEPKFQTIKAVLVLENGFEAVQNTGLSDTWDEIPPDSMACAMWQVGIAAITGQLPPQLPQ